MSRTEGGVALERSGPSTSGGGPVWQLKRLLSSSLGVDEQPPTQGAAEQAWVTKDDCERLLKERDGMWRQHEAKTVSFLQSEHGNLLSGLHAEIDRLHSRISDLTRKLYGRMELGLGLADEDGWLDPKLADQEEQIRVLQKEVDSLREERDVKEGQLQRLKVDNVEKELESELRLKEVEGHVKDLKVEVDRKASIISTLSSQVQQTRVAEALARRSGSSSSPLRSVSVSVQPPVAARHFQSPLRRAGWGRSSLPLPRSASIDSPALAAQAQAPAPFARRFSNLGEETHKEE